MSPSPAELKRLGWVVSLRGDKRSCQNQSQARRQADRQTGRQAGRTGTGADTYFIPPVELRLKAHSPADLRPPAAPATTAPATPPTTPPTTAPARAPIVCGGGVVARGLRSAAQRKSVCAHRANGYVDGEAGGKGQVRTASLRVGGAAVRMPPRARARAQA